MNAFDKVIDFVRDLQWDDLSTAVQERAKACLLDGLCAVIAGGDLPVTQITDAYAK
tara:strand:+ start:697 stop:864 length:168 start_codon:yes stop_codon:yes gene_type:complete